MIKDSYPNSCRKCNTYYWDLKRLREHYSDCRRVQDKLSLCDFCGRGFTTKINLQVHRKIHGSGPKRTFECFMCRGPFQYTKSLKQHLLLKHIDEKPKFLCDICGKEIMWRSRYVRHLKIHSNDFPFECSHCGKKFQFKDKLSIHVRTHTGEKPYHCPLCDYRCGNDGNMCKHLRFKHGKFSPN